LQRRVDEVVAVPVLAFDREERLTRQNRAAIDRKSAHAGGQRAFSLRAHRGGHRLDRP
jgi:hypothetical protein